jgi:hypothetical protein
LRVTAFRDFRDERDQVAEVHRLGQDAADAGPHRRPDGGGGGRPQDAHRAGPDLLEAAVQFQAVHVGQHVVGQGQPVGAPPGQLQGGRAVVGHAHPVAQVRDDIRQGGAGVVVVVHDENGGGCHSPDPVPAVVVVGRPL